MSKLLIPRRKLLIGGASLIACPSIVRAQMTLLGAGGTKAVSGGVTKSYTFVGNADNNGSVGNTWTVAASSLLNGSGTFGTATSTKLAIVMLAVQNAPTLTVTVGGVSLSLLKSQANSNTSYLYAGTISGVGGTANVVVTGGNFLFETMMVYYADGLASNTAVGVGGGATSAALTTQNGDYVFAISIGNGTVSWASSTQTPSNTHSDTTNSVSGYAADWTSTVTGAFAATVSGITTSAVSAANWR